MGPTDLKRKSLLHVLWHHSWIVMGSTFLVLVAGFIYLVKATPIYTSTARIYVEQSGPKIMGDLEEGVMTGSKNYLYTQAELIKATPIVSEALKDLSDQRLLTFMNVDNRLEYLKESLKAEVGKKDDILKVSFNSPYPAEAANIVNTVVDNYITFHAERKRNTASEVLKVLQNQKKEYSEVLSEQLRKMMDFKDKNEGLALQTDKGGNMILDRLNRLAEALTEAQLATLEAKSYYEAAQQMVSTPEELEQFVEAQQIDQYGSYHAQKIQLETTLEDMNRRRADRLRQVNANHPSVKAVDAEIQQLEKDIEEIDRKFALSQLATLEQKYLTAKEREEQLGQHFEEQRQQALELSQQISEYTILQNDYTQSQKTIEILDNRIKELNVTEDAGVLNITILEVARPAEKPSAPQKAKVMSLALMLGLILGGGLAVLRDFMDYRIRTIDEVMTLLHSPTQSSVLGTIPSMSRRLSPSERGQKVYLDSSSGIAEAFRTIRTSIFFSVPKDQARVIQITSPMQGEGKSTLTSNLGIAMAQNGQRVLIVDADFRRPTQHIIFQTNRDVGLSGILTGMLKPSQGILKTPIARLSLLSCGPEVPNPAEMLGSGMFRTLIEKLKGVYDRILLDSTPVLPVADASIVAAICDASILVVRADKSTHKALQYAAGTLHSVGGHLIGAIVNDVTQSRHGGYGYGYGYEYKYNGKNQKPKTDKADTVRPEIISYRKEVITQSGTIR